MFNHLATGKYWDIGLDLVTGCTKVSPACDHCWSLTAANMRQYNPNPKTRARFEGVVDNSGPRPQWTSRVNLQGRDLRKIGAARQPSCYCFWNDLFHPGVSLSFLTEVMFRIIGNPWHFYIICTKWPERALDYFSKFVEPDFNNRLMLMTTAENQHWADIRIPQLLQIPGVLHGVSVEPCLEPVDLSAYKPFDGECFCQESPAGCKPRLSKRCPEKALDFVITGGETGPLARPSHPDWFRQLQDDCHAAGVPFLFKSWGEWAPVAPIYEDEWPDELQEFYENRIAIADENKCIILDVNGYQYDRFQPPPRSWMMEKIGKRAAGRLLDGVEHNGVPKL